MKKKEEEKTSSRSRQQNELLYLSLNVIAFHSDYVANGTAKASCIYLLSRIWKM